MPAIANEFVLFQIFAWSFILETVPLGLMFLAGCGGMVSLAQMTIAGFAGYMVAIFGVNGVPAISIGWSWGIALPMALFLALIFSAIVGALAVRTEGIYTIMITLAIASAFFYFTNENYAIFNGHLGINSIPTPKPLQRRLAIADTVLLLDARRRGALVLGSRLSGTATFQARACRGSATTRGAWRRSVWQIFYAHRVHGLCLRRTGRRARGRAARMEQRRDRARDGQRVCGDRHPHHRGRRRDGQSDRTFHRRPDLCGPQDVCSRCAGEPRPRRRPIPDADPGSASSPIVFFSPDGVIGLRENGAVAGRGPECNQGLQAAMDSVAQRLSAVGTGNALELRGVTLLFGALAALADVTLTVRPGERRAVLGSNATARRRCSTASREIFCRTRARSAFSARTSPPSRPMSASGAACAAPTQSPPSSPASRSSTTCISPARSIAREIFDDPLAQASWPASVPPPPLHAQYDRLQPDPHSQTADGGG